MKYPAPNKDLGQHFLRDQSVINKITTNFKDEAEVIIEVGPGPGVLTRNLSQHKLPFYVIEKDERFPKILEEFLPEKHIFLEDALKFNWSDFLITNKIQDKKIWLVSNLPYNVSAPLLMSFMKNQSIKYMTLMFQKEVGEKTYLRQDIKNQMNSLLALSQTYFRTKLLSKVLPGAFSPPPKVDSVVVSYERYEVPAIEFENFDRYERFLRLVFSQKRKQLGKVLKASLESEKSERFWSQTSISATTRAEALELPQIHELFRIYASLGLEKHK